MPKNVVTLTMLAATDTRGRLHRVNIDGNINMSYPEKQAYEWYRRGDLVPTEVLAIFRYSTVIFSNRIHYIKLYQFVD